MKPFKAFLIAICLAGADAAAADSVWSASVDNGCKPGIGFRITQTSRGFAGFAYILHPDFAHDFSHGAKRKMDITDSKADELRFKLDWGDGNQRSYILHFAAPLGTQPVKGTLQDEPANGKPTEFFFQRLKSK